MSGPAPLQRLDSWKEIAAYLKRTVRTVQRWEKEGLPVHRLASGGVFAYATEIDEWFARRSTPPKQVVLSSPRRIGIAAAVLAALAVSLALTARRGLAPQQQLVLITALDNPDHESLLDGTVPYLVEREISQSKRMQVVSPQRVEDTLRLMRKEVRSQYVDASLAPELCQRIGIAVFVRLKIQRVWFSRLATNSMYLLSAEEVDPASHRTLRLASEEFPSLDGASTASQRLARQITGDPPDPGSANPQPVTTASLRAYQLFTQAYWESRQRNPHGSEQLLRAALAEDPGFATAHIWLAWMLWNQRRNEIARMPVSEFRAVYWQPYLGIPEMQHEASEAVALSKSATERERQFIAASDLSMCRDQRSLPAWRSFVTAYPEDFFGRNNLEQGLIDRFRSSERDIYRRAEMRPDDALSQYFALTEAVRQNDLAIARRRRDDILRAFEAEPGSYSFTRDYADKFRLQEMWLDGRLDDLRAEVDRLPLSDSSNPVQRYWEARTAGSFCLAMGRITDAEAKFALLSPRERETYAVRIAYERDSPDALKAALANFDFALHARSDTGLDWQAVPLLVPPGWDRAASDAAVRGNAKPINGNGSLSLSPEFYQSREASLQGDVSAALGILETHWTEFFDLQLEQYIAQAALARAYELKGDDRAALRTLEAAGMERLTVYSFGPSSRASNWYRNQYDRARLLRKLGRATEAKKVEAVLRRDLRLADPTHPILIRLSQPNRPAFNLY